MPQSPQYFRQMSLARCGLEHILKSDAILVQFWPGSSVQLPTVGWGTMNTRKYHISVLNAQLQWNSEGMYKDHKRLDWVFRLSIRPETGIFSLAYFVFYDHQWICSINREQWYSRRSNFPGFNRNIIVNVCWWFSSYYRHGSGLTKIAKYAL